MNEIARPAEAVPVAAPPPLVPTARGLSPLNRRRLSNFRRNRLASGRS